MNLRRRLKSLLWRWLSPVRINEANYYVAIGDLKLSFDWLESFFGRQELHEGWYGPVPHQTGK